MSTYTAIVDYDHRINPERLGIDIVPKGFLSETKTQRSGTAQVTLELGPISMLSMLNESNRPEMAEFFAIIKELVDQRLPIIIPTPTEINRVAFLYRDYGPPILCWIQPNYCAQQHSRVLIVTNRQKTPG